MATAPEYNASVMEPRLRRAQAGIISFAGAYVAVLLAGLLALKWNGRPFETGRAFETAIGLLFGAELLVVVFAALADIRFVPRVLLSVAFAAYVTVLLMLAFAKDGMSFAPDKPRDLLFCTIALCGVFGLLLPIRLYAGTVGWPRSEQLARRPSVSMLLWIIAYFSLAPLPMAAFVGGEAGFMALIFALPLWAICAGPLLAILSQVLWVRVFGSVIALMTYGLWIAALRRPLPGLEVPLSCIVLTPLVATILLRCFGMRLRR